MLDIPLKPGMLLEVVEPTWFYKPDGKLLQDSRILLPKETIVMLVSIERRKETSNNAWCLYILYENRVLCNFYLSSTRLKRVFRVRFPKRED